MTKINTEKIMKQIGLLVLKHIKANAPVDTGRLRNSFTMRMEGNEVIISSNVEYAPYVEYGTGIYVGHDYIRPKKAKALHWEKEGKDYFAKKVKGMPGTFFIARGIQEGLLEAKFRL